MIPVLTVAQMRHIDELAIGSNAVTGFSYMLKAGIGLFDAARKLVSDPSSGDIAIVCGKGNNGGDGYIAGSLLLDSGYRTMCFCLSPAEDLSSEARIAWDEYTGRKGNFMLLDDAGNLENLCGYALIIDALLGTGAKGNPHGLVADAIALINKAGVPVLAVDTPSGLDNDTGKTFSSCVKATTTVAMGFPKIGSFFYPGKSSVGDLIVRDLNYPDEIVKQNNSNIYFPTNDSLKKFLPPRKPAGSKYDHGLVLALTGSRGMAGSAALAANAAMRSGCGMVHALCPRSLIDTLAGKVTEVVLHPIAETEQGTPSLKAFDTVMEYSGCVQSVCIGPGLSHNAETGALVRKLVAAIKVPVVLDADGLNAYKGSAGELKNHTPGLVITPHAGEWSRLFGSLPENPVESFSALQKTAVEYDMTILYKGNPTRIADPQGNAFILPTGNSGMATAGCGDVLAGIIAALIAQGCSATQAALLGAYIHGEAGNAAAHSVGEYCLIASDIITHLPAAFEKLA